MSIDMLADGLLTQNERHVVFSSKSYLISNSVTFSVFPSPAAKEHYELRL